MRGRGVAASSSVPPVPMTWLSGTVLATLGTLSTITIKFTGNETLGDGYDTNFFEDDNALNVS